jgi:hypothetical protein
MQYLLPIPYGMAALVRPFLISGSAMYVLRKLPVLLRGAAAAFRVRLDSCANHIWWTSCSGAKDQEVVTYHSCQPEAALYVPPTCFWL